MRDGILTWSLCRKASRLYAESVVITYNYFNYPEYVCLLRLPLALLRYSPCHPKALHIVFCTHTSVRKALVPLVTRQGAEQSLSFDCLEHY